MAVNRGSLDLCKDASIIRTLLSELSCSEQNENKHIEDAGSTADISYKWIDWMGLEISVCIDSAVLIKRLGIYIFIYFKIFLLNLTFL